MTRWRQLLPLLGALACGGAPNARPTDAPVVLRVGTYLSLGVGPLLLAQARGYFAEEGIAVEVTEVRSDQGRLAAILSGEVDLLASTVTIADFASAAKGVPLRTVADRGSLVPGRCAYIGFVLRPGLDSATAGPKIRKASMTRDGPGLFLLDRLLSATGGRWEDVERVPMPSAARPAAIARGELDLAEAESPHLQAAAERGQFWRDGADVVPGAQWGHIRFGERLMTRDRALGVRFLAAYRRGAAAFAEGKTPANVAALAAGLRMDTADVRAACWPVVRPDGRVNVPRLLEYQHWAFSRGLLRDTARADQLLDSSFVRAADSLLAARAAASPTASKLP